MWPASEERLFERFRRRRDPASLARVFDRTAPALLRVAMHLERDPHVAEDLVQQTFLAAIEQADRWDRERGLFPWLVGILSNRARLHRRSRQRAPDPARLPEPPTADPAEHASGRELQGAVGEAVAELGEVYRPVLHLHLFHGLNAKEIGAAIGRPAGTVRTQLVRGLERLRRALPVGLGVAAAISAPALAAMRRRLLERLPTTLNGGGALPATAWTLGGTMTKKWLLLVPAILLGAFAIWRLAVVPVGEVPAPDAPLPSTVATSSTDAASGPDAAPTRDDAERTAANLPVAPIDSLDLGTIEVRCEARLAERAEPVPMAGAWVRLRPSDGLRTTTRIGARTDERGLARLEQVPAGSWTVIAESGHLASRRQVEVEPGGHHQVELVITDGKAVDVLVVDRQRRPVADAEVWVGLRYLGRVWPMECTSRCAAQTDARGRATVVVGAEMRVGARKEGYAESLGVDADAFTGERLVVTLRDQPGHVDGTVYDDAGRPLAGVGLFLGAKEDWSRLGGRDADGSSTAPPVATWTRSDARGRFAFHDVLAGRRNLIAIVPGALDAELDIDVRASETTPVRVTMRRAVRVSGRVLRPDGEPARGVLIYGRDPHGELIAAGSGTDARGTYAMFAPLAGYRIEVRRGGELLREVRSEAPLTGPVERDIVIDEHLL
ncbi:MAG: sigma-70 family RNA polymerase sigma factor, partial [Planctomycetes bacterium]|nr:sigma-70 family RNA polymerase sigma factor [Planctomycetota bacterium]